MRVAIFCGASIGNDSSFIELSHQLMDIFYQKNIELVYGGAGIGIMGELATHLVNNGGKVIGVIPQQLMKKEVAHGGLEKLHVVKDMHERKKMMYDLSDHFLIFPGGFGTLDEFFEILTWKQLGLHSKPITLCNFNHYFDDLVKMIHHGVKVEFIKPQDQSLFNVAQNIEQVLKLLKD